jgi:hypothetical protein
MRLWGHFARSAKSGASPAAVSQRSWRPSRLWGHFARSAKSGASPAAVSQRSWRPSRPIRAGALAVGAAISLASCKCGHETSTEAAAKGARNPAVEHASTPDEPPSGREAPPGRPKEITRYFRGKIGGRDATLELTEEGRALRGSYDEELGVAELRGSLHWYSLTGTISEDGSFVLKEMLYFARPGEDQQEEETGLLSGRRVIEQTRLGPRQHLTGTWSRPNGAKKTSVDFLENAFELGGSAQIVAREMDEEPNQLNRAHASYPEIVGDTSTASAEINRRSRAIARDEIDGFIQETIVSEESNESDESASEETTAEEEPEEPSKDEDGYIEVWYECMLANPRSVSIRFDVVVHALGAAHPNSTVKVLNFDRKRGRPLKLGDLFRPGSKYLVKLASIANRLDKNGYELKEKQPRAEDFARWTASPHGLHFYFDVAHSIGDTVEAFVPYALLKDELEPAGPVAP